MLSKRLDTTLIKFNNAVKTNKLNVRSNHLLSLAIDELLTLQKNAPQLELDQAINEYNNIIVGTLFLVEFTIHSEVIIKLKNNNERGDRISLSEFMTTCGMEEYSTKPSKKRFQQCLQLIGKAVFEDKTLTMTFPYESLPQYFDLYELGLEMNDLIFDQNQPEQAFDTPGKAEMIVKKYNDFFMFLNKTQLEKEKTHTASLSRSNSSKQ